MNKQNILIASSILVLLLGFFGYRNFKNNSEKDTADSAAKVTATTPLAKKTSAKKTESTSEEAIPMALAEDDDPVGNLRLEGQAVDEDGKGVFGATIILGSAPPKTTQSDRYGAFAFDDLVGRRYSIHARSEDRIGGPVIVRLTSDSAPALVPMHPGGGIEVEVYDDKDQPIAGATIEIPSLDTVSDQTDSEGKVTMRNLPPGQTLLSASAPGFAKSTVAVSIPRAADTLSRQRFTLAIGVTVSGVVVDDEGKPVVGAKLIAHDLSSLFAVESPKEDGVTSDKEGKFTLPAVAEGAMRLHGVHEDFAPSFGTTFRVGTTAISDVKLVMKEGGSIAGKVVSSSGEAVPWATLRVVPSGDTRTSTGRRQMIAGEDGSFSIKGLSREKLLVHASSEIATSKTVDMDLRSQAKKSELVMILDVEGTIRGVVVDQEGEPIAEAQIQASADFWDGADIKTMTASGPSYATSDGDGAFVLRGLPESTFQLRAGRSLATLASGLERSTKAKTGDSNVRIVLSSPGSIVGEIQSSDGSPPKIALASVGRGVSASAQEGKFELSDIPPGSYELALTGPTFATKYVTKVVVKTGESTDLGTILVEKGRVVSGRIVDSAGSAVEGAKVVLAERIISDGKDLVPGNIGESLAAGGDFRQVLSDETGQFTIAGLGPKEWVVVADHPELGRSLGFQVAKGSEDTQAELPLLATGSIAGKVSINGKGSPNLSILLTSPKSGGHILVVQSGADGGFVVQRIAEGDYKLSAMVGNGATASMAAMQVVVKAGQEIEANLDVDEGSVSFKVTVTGKNDAVIDAAQVFLFPGAVRIQNGGELNDLFLKSANNAKMAFAMKNGEANFEKVGAGVYSVCVIPINGDMNDPVFAQRLQRNVTTLAVHCQQNEIAESPEEQSFVARVPPMDPLPED